MESRIGQALLLYAYGLLGVFLVVVPWTAVWEQTVRAFAPAPLDAWCLSGWTRGWVSGIGLLDLFVALEVGVRLWTRARPAPRADGADGP